MDNHLEEARRQKKKKNETKAKLKNMSRESIQAAVIKKKECNARAINIVYKLIEPNVEKSWLLANLCYINQSHFQDVVEERAILEYCGYPLCDQAISNIPKQLYKISTKENKVYKITDRKNYCSNLCFMASSFLKDQLYTSPLWLRVCDIPVVFKTISSKENGKIGSAVFSGKISSGAEVDLGYSCVKLSEEETKSSCNEKFKNTKSSCNEKFKNTKSSFTVNSKNPAIPKHFETKNQHHKISSLNISSITQHTSDSVPNEKLPKSVNDSCYDSNANSMIINTNVKATEITINRSSNEIESTNLVQKQNQTNTDNLTIAPLLNVNETEITINRSSNEIESTNLVQKQNQTNTDSLTIAPLLNVNETEINVKKSPSIIKSISHYQKRRQKLDVQKRTAKSIINFKDEIEKKIMSWITLDSLMFLFGEKGVQELLKVNGLKIEDFESSRSKDTNMHEKYQNILKKLNLMELKEMSPEDKQKPTKPVPDYESLQEDVKVKSNYKVEITEKKETSPEVECRVMPLLPHLQELLIRKKIVSEKLNNMLPDILSALGLSQFKLLRKVNKLVQTFNLGSNNICFLTGQWPFVSLIIIKLLTFHNEMLKYAYSQELTQNRLRTYLLVYEIDEVHLNDLATRLVDIKKIGIIRPF